MLGGRGSVQIEITIAFEEDMFELRLLKPRGDTYIYKQRLLLVMAGVTNKWYN
jgi:hypothetical protein